VLAWINDNCVESTVFDPISGTWKYDISCSGSALPSNLDNEDGVVAWIDDNCVQYTVYDPKLGSWKYNIECFGSGEPYALSISYSSVIFWWNSQPYYRGYDNYSGNWYNGLTKPLAFFVTSPVWGSGEYWVHFNDMSLGASSYSWDFDDGTGSYQQSPVHSFNYGSFTVTQHVTGPGGYDSFFQTIKTDSIAPTGTITINNGDPYTPSTSVTLNLSASDNSGIVSLMRFSNDNYSWSGWETYAASRTWTLTSGTGIKTVYVQFQDPAGNTSGSYSDSIELVLFPSINLLSPNGAETWDLGTTRNITWNYFGIADTELVRLVLVKNDSVLGIIAENIPISAGSYAWTVGQYNSGTPTTGNDYKIKIETMSTSFTDQSAADFSIINPSITLLSPNGGEILFTNSTKNITWESTDITGNIKIEYSTNNGTSWTVITSSTIDDGNFTWTVPDTPSIKCLIRVSEIDGNPLDTSDALFSIAIPSSATAFPDFNGDGIGDIIWRYNSTGGYNTVWLFDPTAGSNTIADPRNDPQSTEITAVDDLDWKICGTSDFNGDNHTDIVWNHAGDGRNCVWYMNGTGLSSAGFFNPSANLDWQLCGAADFNGDHKPDLVWNHKSDGRNAIWYQDGVTTIGYGWLPTLVDLDWELCGTGDFNEDGKTDLVWHHAIDGRNCVWYLDGINHIGTAWLPTGSNINWNMNGTGDFNGDGKVDILWRHAIDGRNAIWYLDGVNLIEVKMLTTITDLNWKIVNNRGLN
jgi:hypothetical protein